MAQASVQVQAQNFGASCRARIPFSEGLGSHSFQSRPNGSAASCYQDQRITTTFAIRSDIVFRANVVNRVGVIGFIAAWVLFILQYLFLSSSCSSFLRTTQSSTSSRRHFSILHRDLVCVSLRVPPFGDHCCMTYSGLSRGTCCSASMPGLTSSALRRRRLRLAMLRAFEFKGCLSPSGELGLSTEVLHCQPILKTEIRRPVILYLDELIQIVHWSVAASAGVDVVGSFSSFAQGPFSGLFLHDVQPGLVPLPDPLDSSDLEKFISVEPLDSTDLEKFMSVAPKTLGSADLQFVLVPPPEPLESAELKFTAVDPIPIESADLVKFMSDSVDLERFIPVEPLDSTDLEKSRSVAPKNPDSADLQFGLVPSSEPLESAELEIHMAVVPKPIDSADLVKFISAVPYDLPSGSLEVRAVLGTVRVAACFCGSGPHFASCLEVQCESDLDADVHTAGHVSHSVVEGGDVPCGLVPLASCAESCEVHAVCDASCMSDVSFAASEDAEGLCVGYAAREVCVESVVHAACMDAEGFCFGYAARDVCVVAGAYVPLDVLVCGEFECAGKSGAACLDDVFVEVPDVYAEVCACIAIEFCLRCVSSDVPVLVESPVVPTTDVSSPVPVEFDADGSPVNSFPLEVSADDCSPLHGVQELQEDSDADVVRGDVERPCVGYAACDVCVESVVHARESGVAHGAVAGAYVDGEDELIDEYSDSACVSLLPDSEGALILGGLVDLLLKAQASVARCMKLDSLSWSEKALLINESWNDVGAGLAETVPLLCRSPELRGLLHSDVREPGGFHLILILCRIFVLVGSESLAWLHSPGTLSGAGYWACKFAQALDEKWSRESLLQFLRDKGLDGDDGMVHMKLCSIE